MKGNPQVLRYKNRGLTVGMVFALDFLPEVFVCLTHK